MTGPRLVLVGLPGSGKSTVGALVARSLDLEFRDTDTDIEAAAAMTIADIFITQGEAHFRDLERQAVSTALREHDGVLALGGGAILDAETRADLATHTVVCLEVSLAAASPRIGLSAARPLLVGSPRKQWLELAQARKPLYDEVSTITISTDGHTPEQVCALVLQHLGHP